jgi:hypothetical protein
MFTNATAVCHAMATRMPPSSRYQGHDRNRVRGKHETLARHGQRIWPFHNKEQKKFIKVIQLFN